MSGKAMGLLLALALAVGGVACPAAAAPIPPQAAPPSQTGEQWDGEAVGPGRGCSTVYATDGRQMLGGNNEDSREPLSKVWFVPPTEDAFGLVLFGYGNYRAQGGMNDQGLFFDFLSVPKELPIPLEGKQLWPGTNYLVYDAVAQCATVACVVDLFERYYDVEAWSMQVFFGDATGESAIVEPQAILRQTGGWQVATNFYQSTLGSQDPASACSRYRAASEMLEGSPDLSVEFIRDVMDAVHQDGPQSLTIYSNVYDLAQRLVYVYYFSDFEHVAVIDLEEELAKGAHDYDLAALFPPNLAAEEFFAAAIRGYEELIQSRRVEVDPAFLAAYVGDYAPPESGQAPGGGVSVIPNGTSLMMVFPDAHRYELFPQSETSFFVVSWNRLNERFHVRFEVEFGLDEATGRVLHMDFVFGPRDSVRNDRLSPESFLPYVPTAGSSTTTGTTAATTTSTVAPSTTNPAAADLPASGGGFPWVWILAPLAIAAGAAAWLVGRAWSPAGRKESQRPDGP
jgi:hypothetical protein